MLCGTAIMAGRPQTNLRKRWAVVILLLLSLCQKIFAMSDRPMLRDPSPWQRELHDNQACLATLNSISDGGELDGIQFLLFLDVLSGGTLKFDDFHEVPLDLRLVFYAAACSGGRDCTSGLAAISLDPLVHSSIVLEAFCMQIAEIINEPDYLKFSFRYILHHENSLTPEEILAGADGNEIVSCLEIATERVVRNALGCSEGSKRTRGFEKRRSSDKLQIYPFHDDGSRLLQRLHMDKTPKRSFPEPPLVKVVGSRQLQECEYTVEAKVDELFAYNCDPLPSSADVNCALVGSSVTLTALALHDELTDKERSALRRNITTALSNSFNDGSFVDQLP